MRIGITGGKGGTGKSTIATALAVELAKNKKVLLVDADVDCPNDHLILNIKRKKVKDVEQIKPVWDFKKCIKCGECSKACKEHAIVCIKEKYPIFVPELCIGCNACRIVCPVNAIGKGKQVIGAIYKGKGYNIDLLTGELKIGYEEASPVVNTLKKEIKNKYDYILVDTAAGTHCSVISALLNCDLAFAVTEPTPLGAHDLHLILKLCKVLKIPCKVVLNRADIGDVSLINKIVKKYNSKIVARLDYSKKILEAYSKGEPIEDKAIGEIIKHI